MSQQEHITLKVLMDIAERADCSFEGYLAALKPQLEPRAAKLRREASEYIGAFEKLLAQKPASSPTAYFIPLKANHAVVGPVCSVLRGKFPTHAFIGRVETEKYALYELRIANQSAVDLTALLSNLAATVPLASFGGHPSGAGAVLDLRFANEFEQQAALEFQRIGFRWEELIEPTIFLDRHNC